MTTTLQQIASSQASPEILVNENFSTLSAVGALGKRQSTTSFLTWGYYGGQYGGTTIADGTVALTDAAVNYVVVHRTTGVVSVATNVTNWDSTTYARLYKLTTAAGSITVEADHRMDTNGLLLALPPATGVVAGSGGGDTRVIYVDGTTTAGDGTFTFNKTSKALTVQSLITPTIAAAAALALSAVGALTLAGASFAATATGAASVTGGTTLGLTATAGAVTIDGTSVDLKVGGVSKWGLSAAGHITATTDNAQDIGGSAASRPRTIYAATSVAAPAFISNSSFGLAAAFAGAPDVLLVRDAANTLAQRNGASAQEFRLYNTWIDAANNELMTLDWSANIAYLLSAAAGTGVVRPLTIGTSGAASLSLRTAGTDRWTVNGSGHFMAGLDGTYDIGASGVTRPRDLHLSRRLVIGHASTDVVTPIQAFGTTRLQASFQSFVGAETKINGAILGPKNSAVQIIGGSDNESYNASILLLTPHVGATTNRGSDIYFVSSRATTAQVAANAFVGVLTNDLIGQIMFGGDDGVDRRGIGATISGRVSENWGVAAHGAELYFRTTANGSIVNTLRWIMSPAGHFLGGTDNLYDIGAAGATRPRIIFPGTGIEAPAGDLGYIGSGNRWGNVYTKTVTFSASIALQADAVGVLAQRSGVNAQSHYFYNTWTDASNYERLDLRWTTNVLFFGTHQAGTGVARSMSFVTGGTARWEMTTTGHFQGASDNAYDIGASGASRPRNVYVGTDITAGGTITVGAALQLQWAASSRIYAPSDGVIRLTNAANADFGRLQFGGTTSSFPALKRTTTSLEVKLADDSDFAPLYALTVRVKALTVATLPAAATAGAGTRSFVTDSTVTHTAGVGAVVAGGGANAVPVYSDGAAWRIG